MLDLLIGEGRVQMAAPVDEAGVTIDKTLLIHAHEGLNDSGVAHFIEGEGEALPVDRDAHAAELVVDLAAIFVFPVPDALHELFAAEVMPRELLRLPQLLLDDALSSDTGVIATWEPERLVAGHAAPPHDGVLDGKHESVAQVESTRHVRGRDHHHIRLLLLVQHLLRIRVEESLLLPPGVPGCLDLLGVVGLFHGLRHIFLLARHGRVGSECGGWLGGLVASFGFGGATGLCVAHGSASCFAELRGA
mmetsp:Transcript_22499/g.27767  ORF Transcript_22499/g.27767 Transcript_22499/m.27767 type:complete len:248 (-) Transcript_22499:125-868(-)